MSVTVPVFLSGKDTSGKAFREECWTVSVGRHGASIRTSRAIAPGSELLIENTYLGTTALARALRFTPGLGPREPGVVAVELINVKNVWGIQYPPGDWRVRALAAGNPENASCPSSINAVHEIDLSGSLSMRPPRDGPSLALSQNSRAPIPGLAGLAAIKATEGAADGAGCPIARELMTSNTAIEPALRRLEQAQAEMQERLLGLAQTITVSCAGVEELLSRTRETGHQMREQVAAFADQSSRLMAEEEARLAGAIQMQISAAVDTILARLATALGAQDPIAAASAPPKPVRRRRAKRAVSPRPPSDPPHQAR